MMNFLIGHAQNNTKSTGVTVIIAPNGAVGGVSVRGAAPGTRETDLLRPMNMIEQVHAIVLCGGSAYGLEACCGVMDYLREQGIGYQVGNHVVPIVPGAVLFDLNYKEFAYPNKELGYQAAANATANHWTLGNVGAGTGATIGKILGPEAASKGGIGISTYRFEDGLELTAVIAVNAFGDVYNQQGKMIAGVKAGGKTTVDLLQNGVSGQFAGENTTIGCILTNAKLSVEQANKLADIAHDGLALSIRPVHTTFDGDTLFALGSGDKECDFLVLSTVCVNVVQEAVIQALS